MVEMVETVEMVEPAPLEAPAATADAKAVPYSLKLHRSRRSSTGFKKVYYRPLSYPLPYVPEDEMGLPRACSPSDPRAPAPTRCLGPVHWAPRRMSADTSPGNPHARP